MGSEMKKEDIVHRITFSAFHSACVHRDIISNELNEIVKSIYITNSDNGNYSLEVEFDPTGMVGQGDGWIWNTAPTSLDKIVEILDVHNKIKISEWDIVITDNICEVLFNETDEHNALFQNELFEEKYDSGLLLLPDLLGYVKWENMPYTYKIRHGLI